ncbi:MAG: C10 family peptidase [Bacteroidales bacterium]|nr:C10 family peptidase [Bacteroidales bacterium]
MKLKTLQFSLLFLIMHSILYAAHVDITTATKVIKSQIVRSGKDATIKNIIAVKDADLSYFYAAELSPAGYMIVSTDNDLSPVIAYSFLNNLGTEGKFFEILKCDIAKRLAGVSKIPKEKLRNRKQQWDRLLSGDESREIQLQEWPPSGTTSTGGWLETNWTQSPPYNQMCPIDPVTIARSYVGCPATAMAQIMNYHRTTNNTYFDDSDDYYHNYSGRTFWIDDDYSQHGFPSFPELNDSLDALNSHYQNNIPATNEEAASLSFACGVAATQVYTSSGSGTFGVSQALDAYHKFGCNTVELLYDSDTSLYSHLAQNMKDSLPAHLALVDSAWTTGHNVVVDGYNSNNYFHVNFGWGGSNNGWYLLPDEMPYNLTVIEGLIVDIMKPQTSSTQETTNNINPRIFPNPATKVISIRLNDNISFLKISNIYGKTIFSETVSGKKKQIDISGFPQGMYLLMLRGKKNYTEHFVVIH